MARAFHSGFHPAPWSFPGSDNCSFYGHLPREAWGSRTDDVLNLTEPAKFVYLGRGDDALSASAPVGLVVAGAGDDVVDLNAGGGSVFLGHGDDRLELSGSLHRVDGGCGDDTLVFDANAGEFDIDVGRRSVTLIDRYSGEQLTTTRMETFEFNDASFDLDTIRARFGPEADAPVIMVGGGTQSVTVNDPDPTISVIWDRAAQQAVIDTSSKVGPTVASRAYALVHTAIYDAWASYDDVAARVSMDLEGNNTELSDGAVSTEANQAKAMSFAAYNVLLELFPDQKDLFDTVMADRLGYGLEDDCSREAAIGIDAAEDLMAARRTDGSNQLGGYTGDNYTPVNPSSLEINDIARWTPENVPIDPEDGGPDQSCLTPHWLGVESFALPETADGETDYDALRPPPPQPFFAEGYEELTLNFDAKTITLSNSVSIGGIDYGEGEVIDVSKPLIGSVINAGFVAEAEEIVALSANLTDEHKVIAEFWEDGRGTAFPPGTFMAFAQFVSARDEHTLGQDAKLFLAMGNAVFDAGIATWEAKVEYDYARPVRVIRDLGELGLIGEQGVDELTGETGFVIDAFGGYDPDTREGLGTRTILAENFVTFQRPGADPSPPFPEYSSGHSAFSAAGAEVLRLFTGSDEFGGSVAFAVASTQFEAGVPAKETLLEWETFTAAADEAGLSRRYGGIHFKDGDLNGRELGGLVGAEAFELAQKFIDGEATDADRPFSTDELFV